MPRVRSTEWKAVIKLLNEPAESVEDLATDVIMAIDALREKRTDYVTVVRHSIDPPFFAAYGPYVTRNAAERDLGKSVIAASVGEQYIIVPLSTKIDEGVEEGALF